MTNYETQLRDEFAKIAFEATLRGTNLSQEAQEWKDTHLGGYSYHLADLAMAARTAAQGAKSMTAEEKLNAATNALKKVLSAVQRHLPPDGISEREAMGEIIEAVDPWPLDDTVSAESKRTAEEKIEEVMGLAKEFALRQADTREERSLDAPMDEVAALYDLASLAHDALETKLRELIKDDKTTALTVELKVTEIEKVKGLIDLLRKHHDNLHPEVEWYVLDNFRDDE